MPSSLLPKLLSPTSFALFLLLLTLIALKFQWVPKNYKMLDF